MENVYIFFFIVQDLELDHLSLPLLVASELEMLAALNGKLAFELALAALQLQYQLFRCLGL